MQETQETQLRSLDWEDSREKDMTTHSSILAWRIPWTEEPGRIQSIGLQRVRHNWSFYIVCTHRCDIGDLLAIRSISIYLLNENREVLNEKSGALLGAKLHKASGLSISYLSRPRENPSVPKTCLSHWNSYSWGCYFNSQTENVLHWKGYWRHPVKPCSRCHPRVEPQNQGTSKGGEGPPCGQTQSISWFCLLDLDSFYSSYNTQTK